jgi:carboxypeptidase Q
LYQTIIITLSFVVVLVKSECNLPLELKDEIASYAVAVETIINAATSGSFKGVTYNELATFIDKFGPRKVGSDNLENAIDYMLDLSTSNDLENVHGEEVEVPVWERGTESATLLEPRNKTLPMLGLIYSVGTPPEGILAEALVVTSFDDLTEKASLAQGKIVVFNEEFESYGVTGRYRGFGAVEAAKVGAVATLIRSVSPFSPVNPHTGILRYDDNVTQIPAACIASNDANMLYRMQERVEKIKILLKMEAKMLPNAISRNGVAELQGTTNPEKVVIVSAHLDSVDVGEGAMDDGGGVFISWAAVALLRSLGLRPKRTVRAIYWTAEEAGGVGLSAYQETHANESENFNFIMDTDVGTFTPLGIDYEAGANGGCILEEVMKLLTPINATQANLVEIGLWPGFPTASLNNANDEYFWYHHSPEDTMDIEDSDTLDKCTAVWTSVAYVLADLSIDFPKD